MLSLFRGAEGTKSGWGTNQTQVNGVRLVWKCLAHRGFCHVDADEEDELSDEEVDAQILVDGVAVALQAPEEAEGEDADGEADQRHHDPDTGDDGQEQLVAHVDSLWTEGGGGRRWVKSSDNMFGNREDDMTWNHCHPVGSNNRR